MPDTDDPYGLASEVYPPIQRPSRERGEDILHHTPGIAARGIAPRDAVLGAVVGIDMVVARRSGSDHTHTTA